MADPREAAVRLDGVTRLLGALALLALFALIGAAIAVPSAFGIWFEGGLSSIMAAVMAGLVGVAMTALLVFVYARFRLPGLIRAAERMAAGELGVSVGSKPSGGGLEGRLARALDKLSVALVETTDAATMDRLTDVSNRATLLA